MIDVYRLTLTKAQLGALEPARRNALLLLGHGSNQLTVLSKTLHFSLNNDVADQVQQTVCAGQTQILLRLLVGLVFETWDMVRSRIVETPLFERYAGALSGEGHGALADLGDHFANSKLIVQLRNNLAYHFPNEKVLNRAFEDTPEDEPWDWYLAEQIANSFYFVSDLVITHAVIHFSGEDGAVAAHRKFANEISKVSNLLIRFMMHFMMAIVQTELPQILERKEIATRVADPIKADEFVLPFYALM